MTTGKYGKFLILLLAAVYLAIVATSWPSGTQAKGATVKAQNGHVDDQNGDFTLPSNVQMFGGTLKPLAGGGEVLTSPVYKHPTHFAFIKFSGSHGDYVDIQNMPNAGLMPHIVSQGPDAIQAAITSTSPPDASMFILGTQGNMKHTGGHGHGGGGPPPKYFWQAQATAPQVMLKTKTKLVMVNLVDGDDNHQPDYADLGPVGGDFGKDFVEMDLTVLPPDLDMSEVTFTFSYPGPEPLPNLSGNPGTAIAHSPSQPYYDYTGVKTGTLRIWNMKDKKPTTTARTAPEYIVPGKQYSASAFKFVHGKAKLWLEGIKKDNSFKIKVTMKSGDSASTDVLKNMQVQQMEIGLNDNNDAMSGQKPPGMPDVNFTIDEADQKIKDQQGGFHFWWSRDAGGSITAKGIPDLAPVQVTLPSGPPFLLFLKYFISAKVVSGSCGNLYLYKSVAPSSNLRNFFQTGSRANAQMGKNSKLVPTNGTKVRVPDYPDAGQNEYLIKSLRGTLGQCTIRLTLWAEDPDLNKKEPVDSVLITFQDPSNYWRYVTTRGNLTNPISGYPIDNGKKVSEPKFPTATPVLVRQNRLLAGHNDAYKHIDLLYIHGFNVSEDQGFDEGNTLYKRLFWTGFRGNLVSFDWDGDANILGHGQVLEFKKDVDNAFYTSPDFWEYLLKLKREVGSTGRVDVFAHSLGNLVAFDALRYGAWRSNTGMTVCHNFISAEAAIWREAFEQQTILKYRTNPLKSTEPWYVAAPMSIFSLYKNNQITYSMRDQIRNSWRFWFNQDYRGRNYAPTTVMSGHIIASHADKDFALEAMRSDYYVNRFPASNLNAYNRNWISASRAPVGTSGTIPMSIMPEFLRLRTLHYTLSDMGLPVGEVNNKEATVNINALHYGWQKILFSTLSSHSSFLGDNFWLIWPWYNQLAGHGRITMQPAFPIGRER